MIHAFVSHTSFKPRLDYDKLRPHLEALARVKMEFVQTDYKGKVYFVSTLQYPLLSVHKRGLHIDIITDVDIRDQVEIITVNNKRYRVYVRYHCYYPSKYRGQPKTRRSPVETMLGDKHFEMFWLLYQTTFEENHFVYIDQEFRALVVNLFTPSVKPNSTKGEIYFVPDLTGYLIDFFQGWSSNTARYFGSSFEDEFLSGYDRLHKQNIILSRVHTLIFILKLVIIALKINVSGNDKFNMSLLSEMYYRYFEDEKTIDTRYTYIMDMVTFNFKFKSNDTVVNIENIISRATVLSMELKSIYPKNETNGLYDSACKLVEEARQLIKESILPKLYRIQKDKEILKSLGK